MGVRRTAWSFPADSLSAVEAQHAVVTHLSRVHVSPARQVALSAALAEALEIAVGAQDPAAGPPAGAIRVAVERDPSAVALTVWDSSARLLGPDADAGLLVVRGVASAHRLRLAPDGGAELRILFEDEDQADPTAWAATIGVPEILPPDDREQEWRRCRDRATAAIARSEAVLGRAAATSGALALTYTRQADELAADRMLRRSAYAARAAGRARELLDRHAV